MSCSPGAGVLLLGARFQVSRDALVELCQKVQYTSDPSKPILLKNPWDSLNFAYVKKAFPESRFIFVHRHPVNTVNSQVNIMRSLLKEKNVYVAMVIDWYAKMYRNPLLLKAAQLLFSPRLDLDLRVTCRHVAMATRYFLDNVANVISVSLESSLRVTNRQPSDNRTSVPLHQKVMKAICARKPARAKAAMQALLGDAADRIESAVKTTQRQ